MEITPLSLPPQPAAKSAAFGAAAAAVADEQPAAARERLLDRAIEAPRRATGEAPGGAPQKLKVTLDIDEGTKQVIASLVDPETGEVKQQLPPEELLRSAEQLHALLDRLVDIEV